ncbi:MAG TPA: CPXCG motif-containing cysteine-rich protein [Myxococcaceae bacterium]|nr:CPXCG motif-containing cysteine-rich protein [Myxococcaceae bacterium]
MSSPAAAVRSGVERFHRGDFHAAHEAWEVGWTGARGPERQLLQALVQLAAAFHQWGRGKSSGAARLLGRARERLASVPSALLGVDVSELEHLVEGWQEAALAGGPPPPSPRIPGLDAHERVAEGAQPARCPYCGERVTVHVEPLGVAEETYVEDCPVCCRPWTVQLNREDGRLSLTLGREDD